MLTNLTALHSAIESVCPISGVNTNRVISFASEATTEQRDAAQAIANSWDFNTPTQEELAVEAERKAQRELLLEAKATAMFDAIKGAKLAQLNAWVDNNFGALTTQQRAFLKLLAAVAGMYLRERE